MSIARQLFTLTCTTLVAAALVAAEPVRNVQLPKYEEVKLGNGMRVLLSENHELPLISFSGRLRGGSISEPAGKEGVAEITAELLRKGAGKRDAAQFSEAVDQVGGDISAAVDDESTIVSGEFMSRDRALMLELLSDMLERPQLPKTEFTKVQQRLIEEIAAAKDSDPRQLVPTYFSAFAFAGHPYGRSSDETSLAKITYEDVQQYYRDQIGADRAIFTFVGDFNAKQFASELRKAFGSWRTSAAKMPSVTPPAKLTGRRVLLVDKPGATQTYFWIGNVGIARNDPQRVAVDLANTAFGGRFTSMLNTELRIKSGLSYGAGSRVIRRTMAGPIAISSYTKTESTEKAIDLALDVLKRFRTNGLDAQTLTSVKSYVVGQFAPTIETSSQVAAKLTELAFYGLDPSDVNQYATSVANMSPEAITKAIASVYPDPANLDFVLIGDASKIRDVAKKYGTVTEMKITEKHFAPTVK